MLDNLNRSLLYEALIVCRSQKAQERNVSIKCSIPQEFETGFSSDWESSLGDAMGAMDPRLQLASGTVFLPKMLVPQTFVSNSPIEMTLPFKFRAEVDAQTEVVDKVRKLMTISSPSRTKTTSIYHPPGPLLGTGALQGDKISIQIANFIKFDNVIITNVNARWNMQLTPEGLPISAEVDVAFKTFTPPDTTTIKSWFPGGGS